MSGAGSSKDARLHECVHAIDHVKKLPDSEKALTLLKELSRHITPILRARGWKVLKLYEICCCTAGGKNLGVAGFCCPAGDKTTSLRIALRLREPKSHVLQPFDHAMRILIHEVSHIVHGNHSAAFYELMADLTRQYQTFLEKGQVLDEQGMPIVGGRKADSARHNPASRREGRERALAAAEGRARVGTVMGGGGRLGGGSSNAAQWRGMAPGAMAAKAAEERQRKWDEANGLSAQELAAALMHSREDEDEEIGSEVEEVQEVAGKWMSSKRANGRSTGSTNASTGGNSDSSRNSATSGGPPSISWGSAGKGQWQKVPCPVCGPVCNATLHGPGDPPPQDDDEGGSSGGNGGVRGGTGVTASGRGRGGGAPRPSVPASAKPGSAIVDLTASDDEGEERAIKRPCAPHNPGMDGTTVGATATWACPKCTYAFNARTSMHCEMGCGEQRPVVPGEWACSKCTLRNDKGASHCTVCGTWRYHRPVVATMVTAYD
jgi:hypothetical protein